MIKWIPKHLPKHLQMYSGNKLKSHNEKYLYTKMQCNLDICNIDNMCRRRSSCMFNFKISNVRII